MDWTKSLERILPRADGEDVLRLRKAIVTDVNSDGTIDVTLSGVALANVPTLMSASPFVDDTIQLLVYRGGILAVGDVASSEIEANGANKRLATSITTTDSSNFSALTSIASVSASLVTGATYLVGFSTFIGGTAGDDANVSIYEDSTAGTELTSLGGRWTLDNGGVGGNYTRIEVHYTAVATGSKTFHGTAQWIAGGGGGTQIRREGAASRPTAIYVNYVYG